MKFLLLIAKIVCTYGYNTGAWFPVVSVSDISDKKPFPINICYDDYVVWKSGESWSMVKDVCPHKLAPLSQGRINENNNIECPYHGQEFDGNGVCVKIPQLESGKKPSESNCVKAIKTHLFNGVLWGFFDCKENQKDSVLPEEYYPILKTSGNFFIRDLPYSVDMALDNFMDPAHLPFAHHGLQGQRSDGSPIPMKLEKSDESGIKVSYSDKIDGEKRIGTVEFCRPSYFCGTINNQNFINIFMIPVKSGRSRIFLAEPYFPRIPKFILHQRINNFLNTDLWLHNAEYQLRMNKQKYILSTSSDISTSLFRKWYKTSGLEDSEFFQLPDFLSEPLTPDKQFDPINDHNKYCKTCSKYHKWGRRLKLL